MLTADNVYTHMSFVIQTFQKNLQVPLLLENAADCIIDRRFYKYVPCVLPEEINRLLHNNNSFFIRHNTC